MKEYRESIEKSFDSFCKRVLKNHARNIYKRRRMIRQNELNIFSTDIIKDINLSFTPNYSIYREVFNVCDTEICVTDYFLIQCLKELPKNKREIVLLYYFLEMTDEEIATKLDSVRQTVQYQRNTSLKLMREIIESLEHE